MQSSECICEAHFFLLPFFRLTKTRSYDNLLTACEETVLLGSNRRCSHPNLNDKWQEHLRSVEITVATEVEGNLRLTGSVASLNADRTQMVNGLDDRLREEGLLNGVEHSDSKTVNGSFIANGDEAEEERGCDVTLSLVDSAFQARATPPPLELLEQNAVDTLCEEQIEEALELSTEECFPQNVSPTSQFPHLTNGHVIVNGVELSSIKEPFCPFKNSKRHSLSHNKSSLGSSTETLTEECLLPTHTPRTPSPHQPLRSPSHCALQPLSLPINHDGSVCNGEGLHINGCASLSRQTSTNSAGSLTSPVQRGLGVLGHLEQDGLSVHSDAVQLRLRQMEAGHQLQVETLKRQVQELWSRLRVNGELVSKT